MAEEQTRIVLEGYNDLRKVLARVDPDLRREMDSTIRSILRPIVLRAKSFVPVQPLSGWNYGRARYLPSRLPYWNYEDTVAGIRIMQGSSRTKTSARTVIWRIRNQAPSGAVFELAGRGPSQHAFVKALWNSHGRPSRLIWRAWDQAGGDKTVTKKVVDTIDDYGRVLRVDLQNITGK